MISFIDKKNINKKVFVGLSGGVDSAISVHLLKKQGYDVTGVYIKGYQPEWLECTWKDDRISAMRSAAYLDIPFMTLDGEEAYKENVVKYMLSEYEKGYTPNGDMLCNREIKFGIFLKFALANGADFVATGHYAQNLNGKLIESKDMQKDQTYFLSQLTKDEMKYILFPIGHLEKSQVRKIAKENNLPVATRKDSQGICFVGDMSMNEFLQRELNPKTGNVLDEKGVVVGRHDGAILYTIGQRHGFKINQNTDTQQNLYVYKKDIQNNLIYVKYKSSYISSEISFLNPAELDSKNEVLNNCASVLGISKDISLCILKLRDISFVNKALNVDDEVDVRLRYRGEKIQVRVNSINVNKKECELEILENKSIKNIKDNIAKNVEVAEGQFAVFYKNDECLGGGIVKYVNL